MKQVLQVKDLSSGYGNITILRDINFQVEENEVVAIIGSNGAGKTTLLKTISNLIPATAGDIIFQGKDIVKYPPHIISQLGIAHVQEGGKLFMNMTVYENLLMGTYKNRKNFQKDVLEDIYQIFPILKKREKQLAKTLSGGEKQMLAIGRGLASKPKFIMLDDPPILAPRVVKFIINYHLKKRPYHSLIEQN